MTYDELIHFEKDLALMWEQGKIRVPVHFSGGNEKALLEIFKEIKDDDWVISTHRNHYHALLHNVLPADIFSWIMSPKAGGQGGSMVVVDCEHHFLSTAIVAGGCGLAVGLAWALKESKSSRQVWCFIGDGATDEGHFYEAWRYAVGQDLPITFVVEDNDRATETTNEERWGKYGSTESIWRGAPKVRYYRYTPSYVHVGTGKYVQF